MVSFSASLPCRGLGKFQKDSDLVAHKLKPSHALRLDMGAKCWTASPPSGDAARFFCEERRPFEVESRPGVGCWQKATRQDYSCFDAKSLQGQ